MASQVTMLQEHFDAMHRDAERYRALQFAVAEDGCLNIAAATSEELDKIADAHVEANNRDGKYCPGAD